MIDNCKIVAGIDEAGRGPLFGPVVACAVIFNGNVDTSEISDSKKISEHKRELIYKKLISQDIIYGLGIVNEETIDKINILNATKQAMLLSVNELKKSPDKLLIDGNQLINTTINQDAIIKGDEKIAEISAASIIAKVTRDKIISSYDKIFPMYGLLKHKGYGTKRHIEALKEYGATSIHRKTFRPISTINVQNINYYESCNIVKYGINLIKRGFSILSFNKSEKFQIVHIECKFKVFNIFVEKREVNIEKNIIDKIKEKDSVLNKRLDVIYIDNGIAKIIKSLKI